MTKQRSASPEAIAKTSMHRELRPDGGRVLCRSSRSDCVCCDHVDVACNEVGGQGGQLIKPALRPAIFDRNALSVQEAGFTQSLAESGHTRRRKVRCETAEKSDYRRRLLLCAEGARCRHRAGQQQHQLAAPHSAAFWDTVG